MIRTHNIMCAFLAQILKFLWGGGGGGGGITFCLHCTVHEHVGLHVCTVLSAGVIVLYVFCVDCC